MIKCKFFIVILVVMCLKIGNACPNIKTRNNWGGVSAKAVEYQPIPVPNVIIHHTASNSCSTFAACSQKVADIQNYHMNDLHWNDIGYNFLIGNDGNVYEGIGWNKVGAHARGYNSKSIGIAFIGNFKNVLPSSDSLAAAKALLNCGEETGRLSKNYRLFGARQIKPTESPGLMLYNEIQEWDHWTVSP